MKMKIKLVYLKVKLLLISSFIKYVTNHSIFQMKTQFNLISHGYRFKSYY